MCPMVCVGSGVLAGQRGVDEGPMDGEGKDLVSSTFQSY